MSLFPMFVKLRGRLCVVIGGGTIAAGKVESLLHAEARVRVIAPDLHPSLIELAQQHRIEWHGRPYAAGDLEGAFLVIAATSAPGVNAAVFHEADARGIFCNSVDDPENCHFYYGSIVRRGDLQIAVSTNGKSPALAQRLRQELESQFGHEYATWLDWLGAARELLRASRPNDEANKGTLHHLASRAMFDRFVREAKISRGKQGVS